MSQSVTINQSDIFMSFLFLGVYGQLQTFCSPHYADNQRNIQHSSACSMVPPFEDCIVPTSMGQAGFDIFHRAFSAHSGITGNRDLT